MNERKRPTTEVMVRFRDAPRGSPTSCPPLVFLPPQLPHRAIMSRPHPWKGDGRMWLGSVLLHLLEALVSGPTSLMRGEGHLVGGIPLLWTSSAARVVVEGGKMNPTSTVSTVDVEFKLRPHPKHSCSILRHTTTIMKISI